MENFIFCAVLAVNHSIFMKKGPPKMFGRVLNTPLEQLFDSLPPPPAPPLLFA